MNRRKWLRIPLVALLAAPLALWGCSGSSSDSPPPADTTAPTVSASPVGGVYPAAQSVALTATDAVDPAPSIFFTTDGTLPTDQSTPYTGPINVSANTVLRYFARDAAGNASAGAVQGYVLAAGSIEQQWAASGHGRILGAPFRHWDGDLVVPASCAKCHTPDGFLDFALDGAVDSEAPHPVGLACTACHPTGAGPTLYDDLAAYPSLEPVAFLSGATATLRGPSNLCMACHQGLSSTDSVDATIAAGAGPYSFTNIHYFAAAASYFGGDVRGGYQYAGMTYETRNTFPSHPEDLKTCVGCHLRGTAKDHTFVPQIADCAGCHGGTSFATLGGSPQANFTAIQSLLTDLLTAIQDYASGTIGTAIAYDSVAYPYFFVDNNANGTREAGETTGFNLFDAKLLRGAYNYQMARKEPCGYIHNGTYIQQLLFDSVIDLGGNISVVAPQRLGFDAANASKTQQWQMSGHADTAAEAFNQWNGDSPAEVPALCAKCHTTQGFADFAEDGALGVPYPVGSVVECWVCHQEQNLSADARTRYRFQVEGAGGPLAAVSFPSGAILSLDDDSNVCASCHQGTGSGLDAVNAVTNAVAQTPVDYDSYDFVNRHFFAAGAILFGSEADAGYEYPGRTYQGRNPYPSHTADKRTCVGCHMRNSADHRFRPQLADCDGCHDGITSFEQLNKPDSNPGSVDVDYDGDGTAESFQGEIDGMEALLLLQIRTYASVSLGSPVAYSPGAYPYFFRDTNADGVADATEAVFANRYRDFDLKLLRAAFNYHSNQDPCGDMHNYRYVLQTTYDSIDDLDNGALDGSVTGGAAAAIRP